MRRISLSIVYASLMAILAPTIAITLYVTVLAASTLFSGDGNGSEFQTITLVAAFALCISVAHVGILGLPAFLLLKKHWSLNLYRMMAVGFFLGCLPSGLVMWPYDYSQFKSSFSYWNGHAMVHAKINGVPTLIGWIDYLQNIGIMGLFGVLSAAVFWLTYLSLSSPSSKNIFPQKLN